MAAMAVSVAKLHGYGTPFLVRKVESLRRVRSCVCINGKSESIKCSFSFDKRRSLHGRFLFSDMDDHGLVSRPIGAVGSGLEVSISDSRESEINLKNVKIVVESRDDDKISVRVDLIGEETQKAFDVVLTNLARTAPPIPGFRRQKGGKTSNVPKSFLLQILGRDRVTKFLIQEIVSSSMSDYVKQEKLKVKNNFITTQTAKELELAFTPGNEFGFNVTMEFEKSETETTPSSS